MIFAFTLKFSQCFLHEKQQVFYYDKHLTEAHCPFFSLTQLDCYKKFQQSPTELNLPHKKQPGGATASNYMDSNLPYDLKVQKLSLELKYEFIHW